MVSEIPSTRGEQPPEPLPLMFQSLDLACTEHGLSDEFQEQLEQSTDFRQALSALKPLLQKAVGIDTSEIMDEWLHEVYDIQLEDDETFDENKPKWYY